MTIEERLIEIYRAHDAWMAATNEREMEFAESYLAQVVENQKILWGDMTPRTTSEPVRSAERAVGLALAKGTHRMSDEELS